MNATRFRWNVVAVIFVYSLLIVVGIALRIRFPEKDSIHYLTYKDLVPLAIAIPAAWLGYCLQRRQSYLKDVRELWSKLVAATQEAIQYTHLQKPTQADFAKVQKQLSIVIEEVRGVFVNIGHTNEEDGLYPFESIKLIHSYISHLGFDALATPERSKQTRHKIVDEWKKLRLHFLSECDRGSPISPNSPYLSDERRSSEAVLKHTLPRITNFD